MTPHETAAILEHFIGRVIAIRVADHRNLHATFEDKSDVVAEMRAKVRELRPEPVQVKTSVTTIATGTAYARGREIRVVTRSRRSSAR